mmetsp:Transcript_9137/g.25076  ORF Transcript_9137/g.25076 Transcript_9137/m.25076 type:complete len:283 (+) Transcript_9137:829-1677(+)
MAAEAGTTRTWTATELGIAMAAGGTRAALRATRARAPRSAGTRATQLMTRAARLSTTRGRGLHPGARAIKITHKEQARGGAVAGASTNIASGTTTVATGTELTVLDGTPAAGATVGAAETGATTTMTRATAAGETEDETGVVMPTGLTGAMEDEARTGPAPTATGPAMVVTVGVCATMDMAAATGMTRCVGAGRGETRPRPKPVARYPRAPTGLKGPMAPWASLQQAGKARRRSWTRSASSLGRRQARSALGRLGETTLPGTDLIGFVGELRELRLGGRGEG